MWSFNPLYLSYNINHNFMVQPVMQEIWVQSLGWEDPQRRERLPTPVFWPGEFYGLYSPWSGTAAGAAASWCLSGGCGGLE